MPSSSKPHRKSIRLKGYDYATPGFYFITICTHRRAHLFGEIVDGAMRLSVLGQMVAACYQALPEKYAAVRVWDSVVMPNHFHCLLEIVDVSPEVSKLPKVGQVVGYFKYMTTRRANLPHPLWQRNYYEHIVRQEREMDNIVAYIQTNPLRWADDCMNLPEGEAW